MEPTNNVLIEEIKELFLGGRMVFKGIKNNEVLFARRGCEEEGKINKEGAEGHECHEYIIEDVKRILSENNFEDLELSREDWEKYVNEFGAKDSQAMQDYLREKIKKARPSGEIYFVNKNSIIVSGIKTDTYVVLDAQLTPTMMMLGGDPIELQIYGAESEKRENEDLIPALFLLRECKIASKLKYNVEKPDEIPENVKKYLIETAGIFENGEEGYQEFLNAGDLETKFLEMGGLM